MTQVNKEICQQGRSMSSLLSYNSSTVIDEINHHSLMNALYLINAPVKFPVINNNITPPLLKSGQVFFF